MPLKFTENFTLGGIAFGTVITIAVYHAARALAPQHLKDTAGGTNLILDMPGIYTDEDAEDEDATEQQE